mgnify:CR=1 FL=1
MRQKLLIVDDEPGIVDMLKSYFEPQYEVLAVYDAVCFFCQKIRLFFQNTVG